MGYGCKYGDKNSYVHYHNSVHLKTDSLCWICWLCTGKIALNDKEKRESHTGVT